MEEDSYEFSTELASMNSFSIDNEFKKAKVLMIRNNEEEAVKRFQNVCLSIEGIVKKNPSATVEMHYIPLSMSEIAEVYKKRNDLEKALAYLTTSRKFLEYISVNRPQNVRGTDYSDDPGYDYEEHKLENLFDQMHEAFDKPDAPPKQDPQEVVKMFMDAQKKREEEIAKENMEKLMQAVKDRQKKLENSRWERFLEYVNQHPIAIALGSIVFLGVFLVLSMTLFSFDELDPGKDLRKLRENAAEKAKAKGEFTKKPGKSGEERKISSDDMQKLQDLMNKVKLEQEQRDKEKRQEL